MASRMLQEAGYRTGHFGKWHLTNDTIADAPHPHQYGVQAIAARRRQLAAQAQLVEPLGQVDLLQRWRETGGEDEALLRALVACVNGVSQGVQNTG